MNERRTLGFKILGLKESRFEDLKTLLLDCNFDENSIQNYLTSSSGTL